MTKTNSIVTIMQYTGDSSTEPRVSTPWAGWATTWKKSHMLCLQTRRTTSVVSCTFLASVILLH